LHFANLSLWEGNLPYSHWFAVGIHAQSGHLSLAHKMRETVLQDDAGHSGDDKGKPKRFFLILLGINPTQP